MSEEKGETLPKGWVDAHLQDVLHVIRGVTYRKQESSKSAGQGLVPILRANNIQETLGFDDLVFVPVSYVSTEQMLRPNDIVVAASSGSRAIVGKAAQLRHDWDGAFGAFCFALRPINGIEPRYLGWFLHTQEYRNRVSNASAGTNINNLRAEHIEGSPFRFPPAAEQRRIADALDELLSDLDAGVAALERAQAKLTLYRASVLKAAVEGSLTAEWRKQNPTTEPASELLKRILVERRRKWEEEQLRKFKGASKEPPKGWKTKYKEPKEPDTSKLPGLPEGWCWANVEMLLREDLRNGHSAKTAATGGVPTFSLTAVTYGDFSAANIKMTTADPARVSNLWVEPDDIFIERSNTPELVGTARWYRGASRVAIFPDLLIRVRVSTFFLPGFAETCLQSPRCRNYFCTNAQGISGSMPKIDQAVILRTPMPLPPLAEQEAIVEAVEDQLSVIDHLEADLEAKLRTSKGLRQAILKHAFSGKLVSQDPNDEPASELLKRIAAERAGSDPRPSRKRREGP